MGVRGKLSPCFIGLFGILESIGSVADRVVLLPRLADTLDVSHISILGKYAFDPSHILDFTSLEFKEDLSYHERPMRILGWETKELRNRVIPFVKV